MVTNLIMAAIELGSELSDAASDFVNIMVYVKC